MSRWRWNIQAAIWRAVASLIPTCFLQDELSRRPGVQSWVVDVEDAPEVFVPGGPCVVTINRD